MIPFFITLDEAKECLREWCAKKSRRPEARAALEHLDEMRGCYLPYEIVKGPIRFSVSRDSSDRSYTCGGYLDGAAVSTSLQQHNLTLDAMEPFDWSGARAYDHGYTAGQTVKLRNIDKKMANERVADEIAAAYLPRIERTMMTRGISVREIPGDDRIRASALLPAYLLDFTLGTGSGVKTIHVAINGQTGRVAVESAKPREIGRYWFLTPALLTAAVAAITWYLSGDWWESIMPFVFIFGMIMFAMFHQFGIKRHTREVVMRGKSVRATREGAKLAFASGASLPPVNAPPVFFESIQGEETPVDLKFFGIGRMIRAILLTGLVMFLPWVIVAVFAIAYGVPFSHVEWSDCVPWILVAVTVPIFLLRFGVNWIFDAPIVRKIMPDGSRCSVRASALDRHVVTTMEHIKNNIDAMPVSDGKFTVWFVVLFSLFLLITSVLVTVWNFPKDEAPRKLSAGEVFVGYVPDFAFEPIGTAYTRFFGSPEWAAGEIDGRSCVSFKGMVRDGGKDRPVLMLFDVTEYERGGEMKMQLTEMRFRDTDELISGDLAERIMRAPFKDKRYNMQGVAR